MPSPRSFETAKGNDSTRASLHRSCHLLPNAPRGVTIAFVLSRERKRWQPGLTTDDPAFIGWHQLVRGIQGSQVHFDFVCGACENGRAATGAEKPPGVIARFAIDRYRIQREHCGSVKKSPMMLTAVETVTKANPVWTSRRHDSDVAAKATARESVHAAAPSRLGDLPVLRGAAAFDDNTVRNKQVIARYGHPLPPLRGKTRIPPTQRSPRVTSSHERRPSRMA